MHIYNSHKNVFVWARDVMSDFLSNITQGGVARLIELASATLTELMSHMATDEVATLQPWFTKYGDVARLPLALLLLENHTRYPKLIRACSVLVAAGPFTFLCKYDAFSFKLSGLDLQHLYTRSADFENKNLQNMLMVDTCAGGLSLCGAGCDHSDFSGSSMMQAVLSGGSFSNCTFEGTNLMSAKGLFANFNMSNFREVMAAGADFQCAKFTKAVMGRVNLREAKLAQADFGGAVLRGVDFTGADLCDANFFGAVIEGCVFSGARVGGANLDITGLDCINETSSNYKINKFILND